METGFLTRLKNDCRLSPGTVVLPEQEDLRIFDGVQKLLQWGSVHRVVLFSKVRWKSFLDSHGYSPNTLFSDGIVFAEDLYKNLRDETLATLERTAQKKNRVPDLDALRLLASLPLNQACELVRRGDADAGIAGAIHPTSDVIKAALNVIGLQDGIRTVSGSFIMRRELPGKTQTFIYADAGVVVDPTVEQLIEIASESVRTWQQVLSREGEPVVAFLSFSSKGSASHPSAEKMAAATAAFQKKFPKIVCDGELQFDAAIDENIGGRKAPNSKVPGRANIFIFPNLDAGNICYKVTERLAGFAAYGPILQGLRQPFCDLSRGCSAEDVAVASCISLLRAKKASL
jgi:phosphate acetyltransferase